MKIECDKCHAKYSIADEKVRGKTFKIRCKKCSNVIIVRDKAGGAAESKVEEDSKSELDAPVAAAWHVAIDGETVGPLSEAEVISRFNNGEIDGDCSVWKEGFDDWLPLQEVDAFAHLEAPAIGGGASDDVFSRAASEMDQAVQVAERAKATPKVTDLTAQRNENSVLFSLDSLQQLATFGASSGGASGGGASAPASSGPAVSTPATSAPSSEGSGLIDIRSMGSMFGEEKQSQPLGGGSEVDDILPSFGGGGLGGLAAEPLAVEPPPAEEKKDNKGIVIGLAAAVGVLLFGMIGLFIYMFTREPETKIVKEVVHVPGSVNKDDSDDDKKSDDKDDEKDDDSESDKKGDSDEKDEDKEASSSTSSGAKKSGSVRSGKRKPKTSGSSGSSAPAEPKKEEKKDDDGFKFDDPLAGSSSKSKSSSTSGSSSKSSGSSSSKKSGGGDVDVDCLLDPSLPKCPKKKKSSGGSSSGDSSKPKPAAPTGPAQLAASDIKAGVSRVKSAAKQCGSKHGGSGKVAIRFSVSGATGKVTTAKAEGSHAGTPLGNCVAAAAKKATFKKFQKPAQGFVFRFSI